MRMRYALVLLLGAGLATWWLRPRPLPARPLAAAPVYSVAQISAGLARNPAAWVGRTLLVRGTAVELYPCAPSVTLCYLQALLLDDATQNAGVQFPLEVQAGDSTWNILRRVPVVGSLLTRGTGPAPVDWNEPAVYSVQLRAGSCTLHNQGCYTLVVQGQ